MAALHSLARVYEGPRDAPLEALRIYQRILALAPTDEVARDASLRLLASVGRSEERVTFYRQQADQAATVAEKVRFLMRLAEELTVQAKDYVQAIDVYREVLRVAPAELAAMDG
ncbi:MAG TPA: hypothetical protein VFH51_04480, partial [Myxococcota bacterium]|nr:hypothetical protein [Myxococcota bacterium]